MKINREDGIVDNALIELSSLTSRQTINKGRITPEYLKKAIQNKIFSMRDITDIIYMKDGMFVNIDIDIYAKLSHEMLRNFERVDEIQMGFNIEVVDNFNIYTDSYQSYFMNDGFIMSKCETIADVIQFLFMTRKYERMINILTDYHYWKLEFMYAPIEVRFVGGETVMYDFLDDFEKDFLDMSLI